MKTVKDMFGPDSGATIDLAWNGREEDFDSTAARLSASMVRLAALTGLQWYRDTADLQSRRANFVPVPADTDTIAAILRENQRPDWGSTASTFTAVLGSSPETIALKAPQIHTASGSPLDGWNKMDLDFGDDFPIGTVADAAALFAELVRIWQPDHAQLGTTAMYAALPLTRAAFISWTSSKAYAEPESEREVSFPFGDGALRVSRDWSVNGVLALEKDLVAMGAPTASALPRIQDVPQFPDTVPPGLKDLDREVNLTP